jgi:DNA-binding Lrp family transcriptional regulator
MNLIKAFMVVNVNANELKNVIKQLQQIKQIKQISSVAGIFDLILEINVEKIEDLNDLIVEQLDLLPAIKSTDTFIVLKDYSKTSD